MKKFTLMLVLTITLMGGLWAQNSKNPLAFTTWYCREFTIDFNEDTYSAYNRFGPLSIGKYTVSERNVIFRPTWGSSYYFMNLGQLNGGRLLIGGKTLYRE
jgi:hypothetical protein